MPFLLNIKLAGDVTSLSIEELYHRESGGMDDEQNGDLEAEGPLDMAGAGVVAGP
ncbi:hypothetical protein GCM10008915_19820 [Bifidobacterium pullorum subsp. gallinarum]|jgi:hypothetical protein